MPVPKTLRQLRSFLGQLPYIRRFIVNPSGKSKPFSKLVKEGASYIWGQDGQKAFEEIKRYLILRQYWQLQPMAGYSSSTQQLSSKSLGASLMPEQWWRKWICSLLPKQSKGRSWKQPLPHGGAFPGLGIRCQKATTLSVSQHHTPHSKDEPHQIHEVSSCADRSSLQMSFRSPWVRHRVYTKESNQRPDIGWLSHIISSPRQLLIAIWVTWQGNIPHGR